MIWIFPVKLIVIMVVSFVVAYLLANVVWILLERRRSPKQ